MSRPQDPTSHRRRRALRSGGWQILLLLAALGLGAGLYPLSALQVEEARGGRIVFVGLLSPGETFSLAYRHSVEGSLVRDLYRCDERRYLVQTETVFSSSNTGLPTVLGDGERLVRDPEALRITGMRRILPAIELWVNRRHENTLTLGGREIALAGPSGDTLLRIRTRQIPAAAWAALKLHTLWKEPTKR